MAEAQTRTEERLNELAEALNATQRAVQELARLQSVMDQRQDRMEDMLSALVGQSLEARYRDHCAGCFGRWLRRPQVVPEADLDDAAEERLTPDERDDAMLIDLAVRGRLRPPLGQEQVVLALEISAVLDEGDVERAIRRAGLWRRALRQPVVPGITGEAIKLAAEDEARRQGVAVVQDGRRFLWEEAVARWAAEEP